MTDFSAPLRDIDFVLENIVDLDGLARFDRFKHVDSDIVRDLLAEAARFMVGTIAPLNRVGDTVGSVRNADGSVTTPPGFAEAYRAYVENGWGAVPFDEGYGGGGFPWVIGIALQEILTAANMGFSLCPLLTQGAIDALTHHGSETQRMTFLPKMVTGEWTGTMNLTEPDAGSDVGAVRSRAVKQADGTYRITGTKIFITYGEHDMADNIVHLVLARTPDAPAGTKGISCFIVPKFLVNADGSLGARNDVTCVSIEHKLGIHASPTCVLSFGENGGAIGEIIGEENRGMATMFTMMNQARLSVGLQGLAVAERAYQQALTYAYDRRQGRAPGAPAGEPSPIIGHPDVRRNLLTMRATIAALRRLVYVNAEAIDHANHHPDAEARDRAADLAALLTPLSKGWGTDMGVELTGIAVQIHGGMGFIEETGVAQHYRDARIATIYEGTNGIQAIDLVGRKLTLRGGAVVRERLDGIAAHCAALAADADLGPAAAAVAAGVAAVRTASDWLLDHQTDQTAWLAGATPYLRLLAVVVAGGLMLDSAVAARRPGACTDDDRAQHLVDTRFFCEQLLPPVTTLLPAITAGNTLLAAAF